MEWYVWAHISGSRLERASKFATYNLEKSKRVTLARPIDLVSLAIRFGLQKQQVCASTVSKYESDFDVRRCVNERRS